MAKNANDKAAKNEQAEAAAPAKETKRRTLTPAERIAKLEADLAEAKAKAEAKAEKAKAEKVEKRAKIRSKLVELNTQHNNLTDEIGDKAYANVTIDAAQDETPAEDDSNVSEIRSA